MVEKLRRRKDDILADANKGIHSLYSEPDVVETDGVYKVVRKFSWKKIISSSLFGFVLAWAVWCTTTIFTLQTTTSVTTQKVTGITNNLKDEIQERKEMDTVLHLRVSKVDDFSRDQIRMLQKAIHDYRMATFDKVDKAKETLINLMIRILENQEKFKEEVIEQKKAE